MADQPTKIVVTVSIMTDMQCLLVKYGSAIDNQAGWVLPTETVPVGQDPKSVAEKLIEKDLGIKDLNLRLSHTEGFTGHDNTWHVPLHYWGNVPLKTSITPGDHIAEAQWFEISALPPRSDFAFRGWCADIVQEVQANRLGSAS